MQKHFRPDGIIQGKETWDLLNQEDLESTCNYPYEGLNNKLNGMRLGEIVTFTAGTGIGKSLRYVERLLIILHVTNNK